MRLSVVVPTLNEAPRIETRLRALRDEGALHELLVVDGGSDDGTVERATPLAERVLEESGGLARQLNRGVAAATGDVVFFPYADTVLPANWYASIERAVEDPKVVGGGFRLGFDSDRWPYRLIAATANLRSALGWGPLGDQALFARREVAADVGFREEVLLEDLDFVRRLRHAGRVRVLPAPVATSVRRWEHGGIAVTTLRNWAYLARHILGTRSDRTRQEYRRFRVEGRPSGSVSDGA